MNSMLVPLLPHIVPDTSPTSTLLDPFTAQQNMLDSKELLDIGPPANSRKQLRYHLYRELPTDRVERR